jgi:hypothetical protein
VASPAMATAAEAHNFHSSSQRSGDPMNTIFDHEAFSWWDAEFPSRKEQEIGSGFSASDHRGAEHMGIEELPEAGQLKGVTDAIGMTMRRRIPEWSGTRAIRRYRRWARNSSVKTSMIFARAIAADLNCFICRSRRRVGWCEFSALLFSPLCGDAQCRA